MMKIPFVLGELVGNVTVTHVEKPDLVWVSPPTTDETDRFLQQVQTQPGWLHFILATRWRPWR
jgi:hypothetical protein